MFKRTISCVALIFLLCHSGIAHADLRKDLEQVFNKYQSAFQARKGAELKAIVSARYDMELRNEAISQKLKFPPQSAEDMVPPEKDLTKLKFIKAMQKGPTAKLFYYGKPDSGNSFEAYENNELLALRFMQEKGSWKFDGQDDFPLRATTANKLISGRNLTLLQNAEFAPSGKVPPVPPALPMPAYVGRLSFLTHGFEQLTIICNGLVIMDDAYPPMNKPHEMVGANEVLSGGLRQGNNTIVIKAVPSHLPKVQPWLEIDIQAQSDKGKKVTVFDFETEKGFTQERQTFEVTEDIIQTGTDRYADARPPITKDGELQALSGFKGQLTSMSYSPDGKWLAASAIQPSGVGTFYEGGICLWNTKTHALDHVLWDTTGTDAAKVLFTPDGKTIVTTNRQWQDGAPKTAVQLWDAQTWQSLLTLPDANIEDVLAVSPDSQLLLTQERGTNQPASLWHIATGQIAGKLTEQTGSLVGAIFMADGKTLVTLSWKERAATATVSKHTESVLQFWDTATWKVLRTLSFPERISNLTYSATRQLLVGVQSDDKSIGNSLIVWDAKTGKTLRSLPLNNYVSALAFSSDGRRLAVAHYKSYKLPDGGDLLSGGEVTIYAMPHFEAVLSTANNKNIISALAFAPDCKTLATSGEDAMLWLWNVNFP